MERKGSSEIRCLGIWPFLCLLAKSRDIPYGYGPKCTYRNPSGVMSSPTTPSAVKGQHSCFDGTYGSFMALFMSLWKVEGHTALSMSPSADLTEP